jgi:hypothetical protein
LGLKLASSGFCSHLCFVLKTLPFSGLILCIALPLQCSRVPQGRFLFCDP